MARASTEFKTWLACDFYGWTLPTLGLSLDANLSRKSDCPRWFAVKLGLLFLHIHLRIEGVTVGADVDDSTLGEEA